MHRVIFNFIFIHEGRFNILAFSRTIIDPYSQKLKENKIMHKFQIIDIDRYMLKCFTQELKLKG